MPTMITKVIASAITATVKQNNYCPQIAGFLAYDKYAWRNLLSARISSPCALGQETQRLNRALTPLPSRHSPHRVPVLI